MPHVFANGIRLFYRSDGEGEPVLFIQGLGVDHRGWAAVARPVSSRFRCISFDNRDVGQSDLTPVPYTIEDMARDALGLMDALGIQRAHIVGASMGGAIAQTIAIEHPERVARLVLVTTYTSGDPRGTAIFEGQALLRARLDRVEFCRVTFPWVYTVRDYRREGFVEDMIRRTADNPLWQPQEAYERHVRATLGFNSEDRLHRIAAPTLVIAARDDLLTPMRFADVLMARIPDARLHVVEGAGHGIIWTDPEEVSERIIEFLGE